MVGAQARDVPTSVECVIRGVIASVGAQVPPIAVHCVGALERGPTGKAPLIVSHLRGLSRNPGGPGRVL
jgi:hypothetical protein